MPCEAILTPNLSKLFVSFLSEQFITSIEMSKWNFKFRFSMVTATMIGENFFKSDLNEFVFGEITLRRFPHNSNEPQFSLYMSQSLAKRESIGPICFKSQFNITFVAIGKTLPILKLNLLIDGVQFHQTIENNFPSAQGRGKFGPIRLTRS